MNEEAAWNAGPLNTGPMDSGLNAGPLHELHESAGVGWVGVGERALPGRYVEDWRSEIAYLDSVALLDQSYRGVIELTGDATEEMLDRILSSHTQSLVQGGGQLSSLLSAKGRLFAAFLLFRIAEHDFRCLLFEPSRDRFLTEIRKYAFLSGVEVDDLSAKYCLVGLRGHRAADLLSSVIRGSLPERPLDVSECKIGNHHIFLTRVGSCHTETAREGFDLLLHVNESPRVWATLTAAAADFGGGPLGWEGLEAARIAAGVPRYPVDFDEDCFPAEAGWDRALTYDKCYVGQEVVARMKTYGSANRRLFRISCGADVNSSTGAGAQLLAGAEVFAGEDLAGVVTSASESPDGKGDVGLAHIRRKFWSHGALTVSIGQAKIAIEVRDLPDRSSGIEDQGGEK